MSKNVLIIFLSAAFLVVGACSASQPANTNSNGVIVNLNTANLPPGFSTSPIPLSNNSTPGIPANMRGANTIDPKGTPIPGIDPANLKPKKGVTPTPGIPDEATLKKMMMRNIPLSEMNSNPTASNTKVKKVRKP